MKVFVFVGCFVLEGLINVVRRRMREKKEEFSDWLFVFRMF